MNNNLYGRNYIPGYQNNYNQQNMYEQNMYDQIDNQINQLVGMRNQIKNNVMQQSNQQHQQPPAINQTFQLAPNGAGGIRYVNSIDDVNKETVFFDTPFFSKDLTVLWIKTASGDIKAYELSEIVQKDEKDLQIEFLTARLNQLEGMMKNEQPNSNVNETKISTSTSTINEPVRESVEKDESTSIPRVSKSKTK